MTDSLTKTPPIRYAGRLVGLDLARAIAVMGMFWAHVTEIESDNSFLQFLTEIPDGRSALLFALLAGISLAILTGRNQPYTGDDMLVAKLRIVGRAIGLFAIAAFLNLFNQPVAIILGFYAVWFLFGLFFVGKRAKFLLIFGLGWTLIGPNVGIALQSSLFQYSYSNGYAPNDLVISAFITGMYPGFSYLSMVFLGMGLGRLDLTRLRVQISGLVLGVLLAVTGYGLSWIAMQFVSQPEEVIIDTQLPTAEEEAIGLRDLYRAQLEAVERLLPKTPSLTTEEFWSLFADTTQVEPDLYEEPEVTSIFAAHEFFTAEPHSNTMFEILGGIGVGLIVIMGCLLITQNNLVRILLRPVIAMGAMPLTVYTAHVVALGVNEFFFQQENGWGFAYLVIPAMIFAPLWLWKFQRGPLEWCLNRLSAALISNRPRMTVAVTPDHDSASALATGDPSTSDPAARHLAESSHRDETGRT